MQKVILFTGIILFLATTLCLAEELTITTYYPSPFGVYNQLNTNTLGVGDNDGVSGLTSADAPDPNDPDQVGDVWVAGDVDVAGNVKGTGFCIGDICKNSWATATFYVDVGGGCPTGWLLVDRNPLGPWGVWYHPAYHDGIPIDDGFHYFFPSETALNLTAAQLPKGASWRAIGDVVICTK